MAPPGDRADQFRRGLGRRNRAVGRPAQHDVPAAVSPFRFSQESVDDRIVRADTQRPAHRVVHPAGRGDGSAEPNHFGHDDVVPFPAVKRQVLTGDVRKISDLRRHPELRFGLTNEFMDRGDGWPSLSERYALPQKDVRGIEHNLAYRGLASGTIDVMDLYSTDAESR